MLKKVIFSLIFIALGAHLLHAQVGQGALKGKVVDKSTGQPLPFVNVVLEQNGSIVTGAATDFDGNYFIKPIPPGKYDLKVKFIGYQPLQVSGIVINADKTTFYDPQLVPSDIQLEEFVVVDYEVPLIDKDGGPQGGTITFEDIQKMPGRSATAIAQTVGGVYSKDDGSGDLNVRGSRSNANYYYIDGIKVRGSTNLPKSAIEQVSVLTGGVPAQYGDVTGGIISITTRGVSKEYFGSFEYITSGYKLGDKMIGLDPYGYNMAELSLAGPLYSPRDSAGNKKDPLLGFFLAVNGYHHIDENPSAIGTWKVKDSVLADLVQDPLRYSVAGTGTNLNAEFLRMKDFEKVKTKQNVAKSGLTVQGKIDVKTGNNTNLTIGGNIDLRKRREDYLNGGFYNTYGYDYALFNSKYNPEIRRNTYRVFARFTQRFNNAEESEDEKSASVIKNAYYSVQADFQRFTGKDWDAEHKMDLFKYGYVGKFQTYQARDYQATLDSTYGAFFMEQQTFTDTFIAFTPSDINPELSQITQNYYELYGWKGFDSEGKPVYDYNLAKDPSTGEPNFYFNRVINIQTFGGLVNGDAPRDVYQLWRSPGYRFNEVNQFENNQFRFTGQGSADIKGHSLLIGFEYEQRVDRSYSVSPRGLWTIGRQLMNAHINELDKSTKDYDLVNMQINYERLNASPGEYDATKEGGEAQSFFDYNVRKELGLDPDGTDYVDFNSYDPSTYKISFFSADELLNNGNNYVTYYGYDPYGNKTSGSYTIEDFFTARDEYGNLTHPIDAFRPIYMAGYVQDKFYFKDLIFNVGLRVDRYDANQSVMKDNWVMFPTVKAGEDEAKALLPENSSGEKAHPSTIGDDFVVYVDNVENPTTILGYRDGNQWYDAAGNAISDASPLRTGSGVAPLLKDKSQKLGRDITAESFEDYKPQVIPMPRIAFSFPISEEATFFAHYDVLTRRPTGGRSRLEPIDYYFIETGGRFINNPSLKPEQTIDYEVGFQQALSLSSSIKLSAFYREQRNMIQLMAMQDAYPAFYYTYANIDFATIKGFQATFDLRRTGNVWMKLYYTLQFADGTGSSETGSLNLVRAGKPNLRVLNPLSYDRRHSITGTFDFHYASGKDYNGPVILGKQILAEAGANLVINAGSGTPYSKRSLPTQRAGLNTQNGPLDGRLNGSRLPWTYRVDARIDKTFNFSIGKSEDKKKDVSLNAYLQVLNLLNTLNINSVYGFTGNPYDDGFVTAERYQAQIRTQNNPQSFRELYYMAVNNPNNYQLPRRVRLGLLFTF